jgi:hypothetical protein
MRKISILLASLLAVIITFPPNAAGQAKVCHQVGGVLMTDVGAIDGVYNLGPVFGDLAGSVAAKVLGSDGKTFTLQHYWVTSTGETIVFAPAVLTPTFPTSDPNIVAVPWGNYRSDIIPGGTGKYADATGFLDYFGMADFKKLNLVLRYKGEVCVPVTDQNPARSH